jgi:hypothetical protein
MMGAALARAAVRIEGLRPRAHTALIAMALLALDKPRNGRPARVYFAGHQRLIRELGKYPSPTNMRHLRRDVSDLVQAGIVKRLGDPEPGRTVAYELLIPVDNP